MKLFRFLYGIIFYHFVLLDPSLALEFKPEMILLPWAVIKVNKLSHGGGLSDVKVSKKIITIKVWDNAVVDDDIVEIKLNDKIILTDYSLQKEAKMLTLNLQSGANKVEVFAFNTGRLSQNTASIEISDVIDGPSTQSWNLGTREYAQINFNAP